MAPAIRPLELEMELLLSAYPKSLKGNLRTAHFYEWKRGQSMMCF